MGRRTAATGSLLPQGGLVQPGCTPHFSFVVPKEKRAVHGPKRKAFDALRCSGPPRARGSAYQCLLRFCLTFGHAILFCDSCDCRPVADSADLVGVVVVLPLLLFSLPLTLPCGRASGSENRRRVYPCTSPGWRFPQGPDVSVPDFYKGVPAFPRRRQEVCAGADRPAEHFFFSTGRGAFSLPSAWLNSRVQWDAPPGGIYGPTS